MAYPVVALEPNRPVSRLISELHTLTLPFHIWAVLFILVITANRKYHRLSQPKVILCFSSSNNLSSSLSLLPPLPFFLE